jgi:hypothetical protein
MADMRNHSKANSTQARSASEGIFAAESLARALGLCAHVAFARRVSTSAIALAVMLAAPGCNLAPWNKVPLDASAGFYESASLTYRVDAGALQQPLDVLRLEGQQIRYEQVASSPLPEQTTGTLTVTYPHPAGRTGFAQARFELSSVSPSKDAKKSSSWNPLAKSKKKPAGPEPQTSVKGGQPELFESWVLDIPNSESDRLFKMLASQGFYQTERGGAGVQLSVTINGKTVQKPWEQLPDLTALIQATRTHGQLVAYNRPAAASGTPVRTIASTKAYSEMLASMAAPVGAGPQMPGAPSNSPFAMSRPSQPVANMANVPQR